MQLARDLLRAGAESTSRPGDGWSRPVDHQGQRDQRADSGHLVDGGSGDGPEHGSRRPGTDQGITGRWHRAPEQRTYGLMHGLSDQKQPSNRQGVCIFGRHPEGSHDRPLTGVIGEQQSSPCIDEQQLNACELVRLLIGSSHRCGLLLQSVLRVGRSLRASRLQSPETNLRAGGDRWGAPRVDRVRHRCACPPRCQTRAMAEKKTKKNTPEHQRLEQARKGQAAWKAWGPYLSERQWGTVREDYSEGGDAWNYFTHDQARSRAYRGGEDGIAGISDERQRLCLALALWNGADPILKERMFGLSNGEGNHGEDVKEYWFYLDSTPTHSYLKCQYKYPQRAFPYLDLVTTNGRRGKQDLEYELLDTGVFDDDRYFDVIVEYAKAPRTTS